MYSIVLCQYIWVIFYWSFSLVQANSNDSIWRIVLPEQLQNWNCQYYVGSGALTMNCDIDKHLQWTLHDFRIWAESQELKELRLHLQCYGDGSISLRQPIGAKDLTELRIGNCYVYNYTNYEISNYTTNLDNRIRTIEYFNSVFRENGMDLIQHILQWENFTSVSKCYMPESLVTFTRSNCSREYSPIKLKDQGIKILRARNEECLKFKLLNLCKHNYLKIFEYKNEHNSLNEGALDDIFKYGFFPELQTINLTDLQLTKVPTQLTQRQWWLRFSKVKSIDVSKNLISTISFDTAPYNKTIFVNMTDNKISKLSRSAIDQLRTIYPTIIDFSKNEIECSCTEEFQSTLNFISNLNDGWEQYYKFLKTETCFKRNISLESFDYFTECAPKPDPILNDRNVIILICLFSVFFGLSCISVTIRFRREIKILTYTRLKIKIGRTPRTHRLIKEYDAFVSYSHLDEKWVTESLCKHLEHSPPYFRLCLHHKHFVPGACISDNIIESVEKSRHTIIVLSNNFLQSEWCILEFRKAFHQNLLERKRHLIVIMLDEISQEDLEPDMKHFLRTHTYLKKSDYIFWDKLIYSLSDSRSVVYSESDSSTRATTNDVKLCVDGKTNESKDETNTQPSVS